MHVNDLNYHCLMEIKRFSSGSIGAAHNFCPFSKSHATFFIIFMYYSVVNATFLLLFILFSLFLFSAPNYNGAILCAVCRSKVA